MNYLAHYVYNHECCGLPAEPYFVLGVALPDFWPHYSRRRRLRWRQVVAARPGHPIDTPLRAGLLNHVQVDRRFHLLPAFLAWQRELVAVIEDGGLHSVVRHFLAHLAVELALDRNLLREDPRRAERFYARLEGCDLGQVQQRVGVLGGIDATGLADVLGGILGRRFLHRYLSGPGLRLVVERVLDIARIGRRPTAGRLERLLARATDLVDPAVVWRQMPPTEGRAWAAG